MALRSLKSQDDIARALAWTWREVESGRMDEKKGRVLIYGALSLSSVLSEHDLEARIEALETAASLKRAS